MATWIVIPLIRSLWLHPIDLAMIATVAMVAMIVSLTGLMRAKGVANYLVS